MATPTLQQLIDAQASVQDVTRKAVLDRLVALLEAFDGWSNDRLVSDMAAELYAQVLSGQKQTAATTDAYLSRIASVVADRQISPVGTIGNYPLRGVPGDEVYSRLGPQYRYTKSIGGDPQAAVVARAKAMAASDMTQAFTLQSRKFMVDTKADGYQRVTHPEEARSGTCGLCYAASNRRYHRSDLLPVHAHCFCTVLPLYGADDPLHIHSDHGLGDVYGAAGDSTAGADLKKVRIKVVEHSELGPQLRIQGQHYRTADEASDS